MPGNASIEISNFVTKGCLSNREHAEEAPKICAAVDLTLSSGVIPHPWAASFVQAGSPCVRAARQYLPCFEDDPIQQRPSRKQPSAPHGCGRSLNCHTIGTIWNGAYPEEAPERDDFSSNRHPALSFLLTHDLRANASRLSRGETGTHPASSAGQAFSGSCI